MRWTVSLWQQNLGTDLWVWVDQSTASPAYLDHWRIGRICLVPRQFGCSKLGSWADHRQHWPSRWWRWSGWVWCWWLITPSLLLSELEPGRITVSGSQHCWLTLRSAHSSSQDLTEKWHCRIISGQGWDRSTSSSTSSSTSTQLATEIFHNLFND